MELYLDDSVAKIQQLNAGNIVPLVLFNSLAWNVTQLIVIPTNRTDIVIYNENNNLILSQINPSYWNDTKNYFKQPCKYYLYFIADLSAISFTTYFIKQQQNENVYIGKIINDNNVIIGNENAFYSLLFDNKTGFLTQVINNKLSMTFNISNIFMHYGSTGQIINDAFGPEDDPYTLRPAQDNRYLLPKSGEKLIINNLPFRQFHFIESNTSPGFITQIHPKTDQQNHFITHICDINMSQNKFSFEVFNINGKSINGKQYLQDWIMFGDKYNNKKLMNGKFYGSQLLKYNNKTVIDLTKYNFKSKPMILTSIRKSNCNDNSQYVSTVTSLDINSAVIDISRIDSNNVWTNGIYLDWIVWEPTSNTKISITDSFNISIPSNTKNVITKTINFNNDFIVNEPVILIQIQQISPQNNVYNFATSAVGNNVNDFILSIKLLNPSSSSNKIELNIMYWAFERITMKEMISNNVTNIYIKGPLLDE
eukprot:477946_1